MQEEFNGFLKCHEMTWCSIVVFDGSWGPRLVPGFQHTLLKRVCSDNKSLAALSNLEEDWRALTRDSVGKDKEKRSNVIAFDRHVLTAYCGLVPYSIFCEHIVDAGAVRAAVLKDICGALFKLQREWNWSETGMRQTTGSR